MQANQDQLSRLLDGTNAANAAVLQVRPSAKSVMHSLCISAGLVGLIDFCWHCLQNVLESRHADTLSFQALRNMDADEGGVHLLMDAAQCRHCLHNVAALTSQN